MTLRLMPLLISLISLSACVGTPHRNASEVSGVEVGFYKVGLEKGCTAARRRKGDFYETATKFCECVVTTFEALLTKDQWQFATYFAQQRRDQAEQQIFSPHKEAVDARKKTH
jgi:hypothetical protein